MYVTIRRLVAAASGFAVIGGLGLAGAGAAGPGPAAPGAQLWASRYSSPGSNIDDQAMAVAVGPDGGRVFVTGSAAGVMSGQWAVTAAYSASTGRKLWLSSRSGASAADQALSPDGRELYVTGQAQGHAGSDVATVAYGTGSGKVLWQARYRGPGSEGDVGSAVAVSPDGKTVFVTGSTLVSSSSKGADTNYLTIAYAAATGKVRWASRYDGPATADSIDEAAAVAVGPRGGTVYVTGRSMGMTTAIDYATVAYAAATGRRLWVSRFAGPATDEASSLAVGPAGRAVYVTGTSRGPSRTFDYATVAYAAATGSRMWAERYNGPGSSRDSAAAVAASPDGGTVFVTGHSARSAATVAYSAATGDHLWVRRQAGDASGQAFGNAVTVSPDGRWVFVAGSSRGGYLTIAYGAPSGARRWIAIYRGQGTAGEGMATAVAAGPAGRKVFVTGRSPGRDNLGDFATVAYAN